MQIRGRVALAGGVTIGLGLAVLRRTAWGRRASRHAAHRVARVLRYESGRLEGLRYRLTGGRPDPDATDTVLADRVRSKLGPLEHRLDVPRVHVMAYGRDVILHGEVDSQDHADVLVRSVAAMSGVAAVQSHLRIGVVPDESRPSHGAAIPRLSAGLRTVLDAAHGGGAESGTERAAARSVLSAFMEVLPPGERRHVLGHLPVDVRALVDNPQGVTHKPIRRFDDLSVAALPTLEPDVRRHVVESVLGAVRQLVPEEAAGVAALLPDELSRVWTTAAPL